MFSININVRMDSYIYNLRYRLLFSVVALFIKTHRSFNHKLEKIERCDIPHPNTNYKLLLPARMRDISRTTS